MKLQDTFKALITVIAVLFVVLVCLRFASAQDYAQPWDDTEPAVAIPDPDEPDCDHDSNSYERFESVRLLPPVKIKNYDSQSLEYLHEDKYGIHVGRMFINLDTVMPKDMWKNYKGRHFWILYCIKCNHIYTIVEVSTAQMKYTKKT